MIADIPARDCSKNPEQGWTSKDHTFPNLQIESPQQPAKSVKSITWKLSPAPSKKILPNNNNIKIPLQQLTSPPTPSSNGFAHLLYQSFITEAHVLKHKLVAREAQKKASLMRDAEQRVELAAKHRRLRIAPVRTLKPTGMAPMPPASKQASKKQFYEFYKRGDGIQCGDCNLWGPVPNIKLQGGKCHVS